MSNSADGENGILNYDVLFLVEVSREQQRVKLLTQKNEMDEKYSRVLLTTPVDTCKIHKGVQTNIFTKIVMENFIDALNVNFTCPFRKGLFFKVTNCTFTDKFLPPFPVEMKFKVELELFGKIKGKKGWTFLYSQTYFGRFKK